MYILFVKVYVNVSTWNVFQYMSAYAYVWIRRMLVQLKECIFLFAMLICLTKYCPIIVSPSSLAIIILLLDKGLPHLLPWWIHRPLPFFTGELSHPIPPWCSRLLLPLLLPHEFQSANPSAKSVVISSCWVPSPPPFFWFDTGDHLHRKMTIYPQSSCFIWDRPKNWQPSFFKTGK